MDFVLYVTAFTPSIISCILLLYGFKNSEKNGYILRTLGLLFFTIIPILILVLKLNVMFFIVVDIIIPIISLVIVTKGIKQSSGLKLFFKAMAIILIPILWVFTLVNTINGIQ